jgi:hypothetical protein
MRRAAPVRFRLLRIGRWLEHRGWIAGGECLFKGFIKKLVEVLFLLR